MFILVISVSQQSFIAISLVSMKLLQIFGIVFGTKTSGSILKGFWCPDEAQKCDRWALAQSALVDHELPFLKWGYNRKSE